MQAAKDEQIVERAIHEARIIVSADSDFSAILAAQDAVRPSFILFRESNLIASNDYFERLAPALGLLEPELETGCVAVFKKGRLRVRRLPFSE
jgi:predicted nuclease of predicted toxin-antitoxin system